jgi:hypothetical protein
MPGLITKRAVDALLWPLHPDEENISKAQKDMAIDDIIDTLGTDSPMLAKEIWMLQDAGMYDKIYTMLFNITK